MPPFLPRKRSTPPPSSAPPPSKRARLADALDAEATNNVPGLNRKKTFSIGGNTESDSSLSDVDSDQFEDVRSSKKQQTVAPMDHSDDEIEWEDAAADESSLVMEGASNLVTVSDEPLQLTFRKDDGDDYSTTAAASGMRKGPSRREKQARVHAHQMHVQFLMFHNAIRNSWVGDTTTQQTLVRQIPTQVTREIERWKRASGLIAPEPPKETTQRAKKRKKQNRHDVRSQRDWGQPSQQLEAGKPDMSHGDPIIHLMKVLSAYWRKKFAITAPGLRKRGYSTKAGLRQEINSHRNDEYDAEKHGERIQSLGDFRKVAEKCEGSRDVGAQLFTALVRGLGIEARMVASLQPAGYGFTKAEQMVPRKIATESTKQVSSEHESADDRKSGGTRPHARVPKKASKAVRGRSSIIDLDSDADGADRDLSIKDDDDDDDDSVVDVTPTMLKERKAKYDRDLAFPIYWTEVVSPITNIVLPVSPLVLENAVAASADLLLAFEPRGAKAEKTHQVMAYVVAHSTDGTAKDVTVRYLRKRLWPGKTKGFRLPLEKVPIYDQRGKIKRHIERDWFKQVMVSYTRSDENRTAVDDLEDASDLTPSQPEKKDDEDSVDTLQSLKSSAEFVLERFLRREEALRLDAKPVRMFVSGKGDKYKEEPVYRRSDVERCLTAESWHKEGRRPQLGETPMKMVPVRAVTLTRKREAEEHERQTGEKQMQGLYSWDQTEYIIPPPIEDGIIPKNSYGNMDCFVPSMVPRGAVHIPLKGTVRICKRLEIDFAEAVTGFEFGNKRAVPVCTGVVIAEDNEKIVMDAWREWNEEQRRKEETKMEKLVLDLWRKFVMGLRIREKVAETYGDDLDQDPAASGLNQYDPITLDEDELPAAGGFLPEAADEDMGGGFLLPHDSDEAEDLVMDDNKDVAHSGQDAAKYPTPLSVTRKSDTTSRANSALVYQTNSLDSENDTVKPQLQFQDQSGSENEPMDFVPQNRAKTKQKVQKSKGQGRKMRAKKEVIDSEDDEATSDRHVPQGTGNRHSDADLARDRHGSSSDNSEAVEEYTPRATKSKAAKPRTQRKPMPVKLTKSPKAKAEPKDENGSAHTPARRGRGRPRKSQAASNTETPKRSVRLLRKDSTVVTSPYFEEEDE